MLQLHDLHRRFGDVVALDGMTFTVEARKVVGFLGPNGAGKTTAMRAVLGVTALDSGRIEFEGRDVDAQARRHFGYMPEERGLYPGMRVLDQLDYLGRLHGMEARRRRPRPGANASASVWPSASTPRWRSSHSATSSAFNSLPLSFMNPICSCSTSRSRALIRWVSTT